MTPTLYQSQTKEQNPKQQQKTPHVYRSVLKAIKDYVSFIVMTVKCPATSVSLKTN